MAKEEAKIVLERNYVIPLRREWLRVPRWRRAKRAINAVRNFIKRHMKAEIKNIRIVNNLNLRIWKHGIQNVPSKIKVTATKDENGMVYVNLFGLPTRPIPTKKVERKEEKKEEKVERKEEKKEEKVERKEEIKEEKAQMSPEQAKIEKFKHEIETGQAK